MKIIELLELYDKSYFCKMKNWI